MTTATKEVDLRQVLNSGNDNLIADALKQIKFGDMASVITATFTGLSDVAGQDITTAAAKTAATITGITLETGENLPPIGNILGLRTTAGSLATHGSHVVVDTGGTALVPQADSSGVATLSDDGKTLTFQAGVSAFVLLYTPRAAVVMTTAMSFGSP
jgi:hypothetical protein